LNNYNLYSINKSVFGIEYQYKYILLKVLEYLLAGRLEYAFVNFPFDKNNQFSLDGKFVLMDPREIIIYEIKTGDNFKSDTKNELKHILNIYYIYEIENMETNCKKVIVTDSEVAARIENHKSDFKNIKEKRRKNNSGEKLAEIKDRVFKNFKFENIKITQKEFFDFLKGVEIIQGPSYKKSNRNDIYSDIEDQIICVINDFCRKLEIETTNIEIPSFSIVLELIEVVRQCSQNNQNIRSDLSRKLIDCLSRRRLIQEANYNNKDKQLIYKEKIKPIIEKMFSEIIKSAENERIPFLWENKDNTIIQE
jgi:hypothetical protein